MGLVTRFSTVEAEVGDLLTQLIRNACVNDGTPDSGGERRSVDVLADHLAGSGLDLEVYEPRPGRASLVARIEGRRSTAPTLLLMGHTDVVPANPERWRHDPFGGELIDGEIWGRGAVDMLNLTASMAVAVRRLADAGFRPDGTLVYLAVADEEALGEHGARHLTEHQRDAVAADYVLTESGGIPVDAPAGLRLPVIVGEKGTYWCRLRIRGTAGHGSQPYRTDNAVVKAAEVVRRLATHEVAPDLHTTWRTFIDSLGYPPEVSEPLLDPERLPAALELLPDGMARQFHACTHVTLSPGMVRGGSKINTIPDLVELDVDIRTLPGVRSEDAHHIVEVALGDLAAEVEIVPLEADPSTISPVDTPLWEALGRATSGFYPGADTVPYLTVGATDARFFRALGAVAYGYGMFSRRMSFEDYGAMFHGDDERVDLESLVLSTELWKVVARDLLVDR